MGLGICVVADWILFYTPVCFKCFFRALLNRKSNWSYNGISYDPALLSERKFSTIGVKRFLQFWTLQEAVGHVDLSDSWFPSSLQDFSFHFNSKTPEETISCGPPCVRADVPRKAFTCFTNWQSKSCTSWILVIALSRVNSTGVRFFRRKLNVRNSFELLNFSQNSLKFSSYLTTGETSLITRRTIDYTICQLTASLPILLPRLPAEIFTQWILEEPC